MSNNSTLDAASLMMEEPAYVFVVVTVIYVVVFVLGTLGNVLVIVVVCTLKDMRTPTNVFLVNLSVADLLVLLVCMPSALVEFHAREIWLLGAAMCEYLNLDRRWHWGESAQCHRSTDMGSRLLVQDFPLSANNVKTIRKEE
jgi:hypothetical protein